MIRDFKDPETGRIFRGERSRKLPPDIQNVARRKLRQINRAQKPDDLRVPRGNRLEELKGLRKGTYSIRINDQWRICFRWVEGDALDVRIEDYHRG
ncbi:MAG: type II toxin-antitoxin system RelE/ParE family toxin [Alphaproteobacteria bacterium]|nr:type II toxin-antitoxin system RelE/ParE family toxin [Alphaproteobacteria bacterium]MBV9370045.1 type II toxin-antitoxin system RelE/ParE family toxin [Alphaproteobacteria bacterium]MBV9900719.1 type II toxin-antitoxin system RelE/ParE family toxin [Alphaproteobacteria bacterium]